MKEIQPRPIINTTIEVPGSKSITHRAIIAASLARGKSMLRNFLECEDTLYTANALRDLGTEFSARGQGLEVVGTGGHFSHSPGRKEIFLGNSGTSFRLLLSAIALARGEYVLTGGPRMHQRPIGHLVEALNRLGVEASCIEQPDYPPVRINARGIRGGKVEISANQSSQYLSSLLLSSPYAEQEVEIELTGDLVSRPYVDLTIDVMGRFGVSLIREGYSYFKIPSGQNYRSQQLTIEGDVSSASYFWAAAAVTGGRVTTKNIFPNTTWQGDIRFLNILEQMGCTVERGTDQVVVHGGALSGIEADMGAMPDMVPTLAAVALFAQGKTTIKNVPHLRYKESDRLKSVALEWDRLGNKVEELADGLVIHGGQPLFGTVVDPHDDHRIAMSLAVVGLRIPGIKIENENCVSKSFPRFWKLWDRI